MKNSKKIAASVKNTSGARIANGFSFPIEALFRTCFAQEEQNATGFSFRRGSAKEQSSFDCIVKPKGFTNILFTKKEKTEKVRAQIAVEFFLVAGFVLVLAAGLVVLVDGQINSTNNLAKTAVAKAAIESAAGNMKQVWLSGLGSRVTQDFFVPDNTVCFLYNFDASELYCLVEGRDIVKSEQLPGIVVDINKNCARSGWFKTIIENTQDAVTITCPA